MQEKESAERYRALVNRAVRELGPCLEHPTEDRRERLRSLVHEMEAEQNEYRNISWGSARIIQSTGLLVAETCLRSILRTDEAPHWLYQAARNYAERYDPRYGTGLIPESAPMVETSPGSGGSSSGSDDEVPGIDPALHLPPRPISSVGSSQIRRLCSRPVASGSSLLASCCAADVREKRRV